jgi:hypothetical protein
MLEKSVRALRVVEKFQIKDVGSLPNMDIVNEVWSLETFLRGQKKTNCIIRVLIETTT